MTFPKPKQTVRLDGSHLHSGSFCLYADGTLFRDRTEIRLAPKEVQLLRLLFESAGRVVSAEFLRGSLWGGVHVSPDSLPRCVSSLRSRMDGWKCIQTVYKRGYRWTLPVASVMASTRLESARTPHTPAFQLSARPMPLPRLAVLPFAELPGAEAGLGAEIADATMFRLSRSRVSAAVLLARDSVFALAAQGATARQVGMALEAHLALAGSISALPMHYRIRSEMIRVADGVQLWIEDFLVPRSGVSEAGAEVARRIAARIRHRSAAHLAAVGIAAETGPRDEPGRPETLNTIRLRA